MTEKLTSILQAEGLGHLLNNFTDQGVTDTILGDLSDVDLKDLGVDKLGERKRLLAVFKGTVPAQTVVEAASLAVSSGMQPFRAPTTAASPAKATKDNPFVNTLGMPFVPIPRFDTRFCIWPVRVQDYEAYCMATGASFPACPFSQGGDHPIVGVSWSDSRRFCEWLTTKERNEGNITNDQVYRLPSDLEWSAAVGLPHEPGHTPSERHLKAPGYPWGLRWPPPMNTGNYEQRRNDQWGFGGFITLLLAEANRLKSDEDYNYMPNYQKWSEQYLKAAGILERYRDKWRNEWAFNVCDYDFTSPVASFPANQHGVFDLGGNVWEWCMDSWNHSEEKFRTLRGGCYATHRFLKDNDHFKIIQNDLILKKIDPKSDYSLDYIPELNLQENGTKLHGPISNIFIYQSSFRFGAFQDWGLNSNFIQSDQPDEYPITGFRIVLCDVATLSISEVNSQSCRSDPQNKSRQSHENTKSVMVLVNGGTLPKDLQKYGEKVDAFEISNHLITLDDWNYVRKWALNNGFQIEKGWARSRRSPISKLEISEILKWCNARSSLEGLEPVYSLVGLDSYYQTGQLSGREVKINKTANGYRLPTAAEWKWAAYGGMKSQGFIYSGSNVIEDVAWYRGNSNKSAQDVGKMKPNELGIYDMSGNVREFCYLDTGDTGVLWIRRFMNTMGGCFESNQAECSIFADAEYPGSAEWGESGFRVVRFISI